MASRETSQESDERPPKRSRRGSLSHLHEEIKPDGSGASTPAAGAAGEEQDHTVQDVSIEIKERLEVTAGTATPVHPEDLPSVRVSRPEEDVKREPVDEKVNVHPHKALPLAALLNPAPNS